LAAWVRGRKNRARKVIYLTAWSNCMGHYGGGAVRQTRGRMRQMEGKGCQCPPGFRGEWLGRSHAVLIEVQRASLRDARNRAGYPIFQPRRMVRLYFQVREWGKSGRTSRYWRRRVSIPAQPSSPSQHLCTYTL
jgi:hypothetical protein